MDLEVKELTSIANRIRVPAPSLRHKLILRLIPGNLVLIPSGEVEFRRRDGEQRVVRGVTAVPQLFHC